MSSASTTRRSTIALTTALTACFGLAGCKDLFTPPPPKCGEGRHLSAGKCCGKGEEWVPAAARCTCMDPSVCIVIGASESGSRSGPGSAAATTQPSKPCAPGAAEQRCVGQWKGEAKSSDGLRAKTEVTISAIEDVTVDHPYGKSCGTLKERSADGPCVMRLVRCYQSGTILLATGIASDSSECDDRASVALDCQGRTAEYRRREEGLLIKATLERAAPSSE